MQINVSEELNELERNGVLSALLIDKNTYGNIWLDGKEITIEEAKSVKPFFQRQKELSKKRVKKFAEVVTPLRVTSRMCDYAEDELNEKILTAAVLEITCGEAPFLANRYDIETGGIIPIENRKGLLDRKLKAAHEIAENLEEFVLLSETAYKTTYAYELQGDNLILARLNLYMTFSEYSREYYGEREIEASWLADIIAWNVFQMDGLTLKALSTDKTCKIYDWESNKVIDFPGVPVAPKKKQSV